MMNLKVEGSLFLLNYLCKPLIESCVFSVTDMRVFKQGV